MEYYQIDKKLLPFKIHYFLINAGSAGVLPFLPVYAKQLGVEADILGYVFAFLSCFTVFTKPLIGGFVDRFQNFHLFVVFLIIINIAANACLDAIPLPKKYEFDENIVCFQNSSFYNTSENCSNLTCSQKCLDSCTLCFEPPRVCLDFINHTEFSNDSYFNSSYDEISCETCFTNNTRFKCSHNLPSYQDSAMQVGLWSFFTAIFYIAYGSITSLSDAACCSVLAENSAMYGKQRMWGVVGWGTFGLISGYLNQYFTNSTNIYNYSPGFYMFIILLIIDMFVVTKFQLEEVKVSRKIWIDVCQLLIRPQILGFITQVFIVGLFTGFARSYLFWYLRTLNANQFLLGAVSLIQCFLGELPFFFFAGYVINKIGHLNTFPISHIANAVRFLSFYFITNPIWGLPLAILQGPAFGISYSAFVSYAKIIAPVGTEATVQAIASSSFEGLGLATGSLLGGIGIKYLGEKETFLFAGILCILSTFASLLMNDFRKWKIKF